MNKDISAVAMKWNIVGKCFTISISKIKYTFVNFKKPIGKYTAVNSSSNDSSLWQFPTFTYSEKLLELGMLLYAIRFHKCTVSFRLVNSLKKTDRTPRDIAISY